ncbi:MAG: hypothetical protein NXI23_13160 [Bacteroidetes bacterium]|jgi:hypothetical protein|nr:hypothetical protein [Bacteroidota bacterium]
MKIILTYCFLVLSLVSLFGQKFQLNQFQHTRGAGTWEWNKETAEFSLLGKYKAEPKSKNGLDLVSFKIINGYFVAQEYEIPFEFYYEGGNIIIDYTLPKEPNSRRYSIVNIDSVLINGTFIRPRLSDLFGDIGTVQYKKNGEAHRIIWDNAFENYISKPEGELKIVLVADRYEKTPKVLTRKPEFKFNQKLPAYIAVGAGASLIGASYLIRNSTNGKNSTANLLAVSGGGIIIGGGIYFLSKWIKYQRDQRIADKYYPNKSWPLTNRGTVKENDLTIAPQITPFNNGELYSGIFLNYSF